MNIESIRRDMLALAITADAKQSSATAHTASVRPGQIQATLQALDRPPGLFPPLRGTE
ncbi:hypothetical protein PIB30_021132 [Stylosanthes scabra]|uniref:Uncharacterized protein n=1 Tax=Stylosanthes scabra TaxID=79078 RepID=A0ABU6Q8R9_9FABA|nr:hypothetical protein [Stylosanthes scabra]